MLALLALSLAAPPTVNLDRITPEDARPFEGCFVRATLTVSTPPGFFGETAVVGGRETAGIERTVYLTGPVPDIGERITVRGRLYVIEHPARTVNGVRVPEWTEIRVETP